MEKNVKYQENNEQYQHGSDDDNNNMNDDINFDLEADQIELQNVQQRTRRPQTRAPYQSNDVVQRQS